MRENFRIRFFIISILAISCALLPAKKLYSQNENCGLRISLLTCSPGDELYSTFGHSALRVIDSINHRDLVFNYGTFNFDEPGFYMKFVRGKLKFALSVDDFNSFRYEYVMENRSITEQVLNLTCPEKNELFSYLQWNYLPANRYYKYDFTFDNCTTRLRDLIDSIGQGSISYTPFLTEPMSFRDAIHSYLDRNNKSWSKLGIDILLGRRLDRQMTDKEVSFLPDYLMQSLDSATISGRPLVDEKDVILKNQYVPLENDNVTNPLFLFSCLFVIIAFLSFSGNIKIRKVLYSIDSFLFFIYGLIGLLLLFMWFGTDHFMTKDNYNLLWAWPTHIVAAFYIHSHKRWAKIYFLIYAVAQILLIGFWFFLPQQLNMALIPLNGILVFRSFMNFSIKHPGHE